MRGRDAHGRSFVTIDPERDGPAQLKDYLADWDPRILGLTGSPEQVDCVTPPPPPSPPRTNWTRRVPRPVLIGHAASLAPY